MSLEVIYRPAHDIDTNFIFHSWMRSAWGQTKPCKRDTFFTKQHEIIEFLLTHADVRVACLPDDPNVIIAYVVYTRAKVSFVHWLYVKEAFREIGVGRGLLKHALEGSHPFLATTTYWPKDEAS